MSMAICGYFIIIDGIRRDATTAEVTTIRKACKAGVFGNMSWQAICSRPKVFGELLPKAREVA